jgi:nicotinamidase-related amidase
MPLTQFDSNAALIVIDLQNGIVDAPIPTAHPVLEIVDRTARLARAFRQAGLSVVLVNVAGRPPGRTDAGIPKLSLPPDWTDLVSALERQPDDHVVTKYGVGAFVGTSLDEILRKRGVKQIFLTGVATSFGVESTARNAHDLGYHVVLVVDAMTDRDADAHRHSIEKIFPRIGELETTERVLEMLSEPVNQ